MQLRHGLETEAVSAAERAAGTSPGARDVTVCFADLVGSPGSAKRCRRRSWRASPTLVRPRDVAAPLCTSIKTIGDAVMFVSTDRRASAACAGTTGRRGKEDLPQLRVGSARGASGRLVRQPREPGESRRRWPVPGRCWWPWPGMRSARPIRFAWSFAGARTSRASRASQVSAARSGFNSTRPLSPRPRLGSVAPARLLATGVHLITWLLFSRFLAFDHNSRVCRRSAHPPPRGSCCIADSRCCIVRHRLEFPQRITGIPKSVECREC